MGKIMKLLTMKEVAAALRVHVQTVRRLIRAGKIPAISIGKQYRIPESFLKEKMECLKNQKN